MPRQAVRTYLEMTDRPPISAPSDAPSTDVIGRAHAKQCPPALWRHLYTEVGREYHWVDRLAWTDDEIARVPGGSGARAVDPAGEGDEPAGYFELRAHDDGAVEIAYFGLLPAFTGRGLGKFMLTRAVERAWDARRDPRLAAHLVARPLVGAVQLPRARVRDLEAGDLRRSGNSAIWNSAKSNTIGNLDLGRCSESM